jgi:hypothetical protein
MYPIFGKTQVKNRAKRLLGPTFGTAESIKPSQDGLIQELLMELTQRPNRVYFPFKTGL